MALNVYDTKRKQFTFVVNDVILSSHFRRKHNRLSSRSWHLTSVTRRDDTPTSHEREHGPHDVALAVQVFVESSRSGEDL